MRGLASAAATGLSPSREQSDASGLLDLNFVEMLLKAMHQSGLRVGLVVQRPPRIEPPHHSHGKGTLRHVALH